MHASFSYYDLLGVSPNATPDEIKRAFRAAVLKYHPDVNQAPNAQRLTEILNEAHAVLSDPIRRKAYDAELASGQAETATDEAAEPSELHACDGCGKISPHLRLAVFFRVWSILIYTSMNPTGGILCPNCRSNHAMSSALFSVLLGPWGFPWGLIYTGRALLAAVRGGERPRAENAQLLRYQGLAFLQRGYLSEGKTALADAQQLERRDAVTTILSDSEVQRAPLIGQRPWLPGQTAALFIALIPILVVYILVVTNSGSSVGSSQDNPPSSTAARADDAQLLDHLKRCATAGDERADVSAAYSACHSALSWIADDQKGESHTSEDYQRLLFIADRARLYEATAASRLGYTPEAKQMVQQSIDDLKTLSISGVTSDLRGKALTVYNCITINVCGK